MEKMMPYSAGDCRRDVLRKAPDRGYKEVVF